LIRLSTIRSDNHLQKKTIANFTHYCSKESFVRELSWAADFDTLSEDEIDEEWKDTQQKMSEKLKKITETLESSNKAYILSIDHPDHAILACGGKWNPSTRQHELNLFDSNSPKKMITMKVSEDYSRFGFVLNKNDIGGKRYYGNWDDTYATEYDYCYFGLSDISQDFDAPPNAAKFSQYKQYLPNQGNVSSDALRIKFPMNSSFKLTNAENETFTYNGNYIPLLNGYTSGSMSVSDPDFIVGNGQGFMIANINASSSFTLENLGDEISLMISGGDTLLSLDDAQVAGAEFDLTDNSIHITEAKGAFTVYLPPHEEDGALVRFSGTAAGSVDVSAAENDVQLSGDSITAAKAKALTVGQTRQYNLLEGSTLSATFDNGQLLSDAICPFGDMNCDKSLSIEDAVLLARYLNEDTALELTPQAEINAEVIGDDILTMQDLTELLRQLC